ncbi:hypothetical protein PJL18_03116 [Paenarthrobacter nicotinovorans]|nr:hypothetical protein [Paenarthrobacter nicotinovorans]
MNSGIIAMKSTDRRFWVTAKSTPPISSGATSMMYGNGWCSGRFGPAGGTRLGDSNRGSTRGERLKSTSGDDGPPPWFRERETTPTVVSPSVTVSDDASVARVTGRPSMRRPLAEFVSTISTVSPTVMRAWRLEVSGSESRMSASRSRPM